MSETKTAPRDSIAPDSIQDTLALEKTIFAISRALPVATQKSLYLQALKVFGRIGKTCEVTTIPYQSLSYWRQSDPDFDTEIKSWQSEGMVEALISASFLNAVAGGAKGYKDRELLLKAFGGDTFKDRLQVDLSVTVSAQLNTARGIADVRRARLKALVAPETPVLEAEFVEVLEEGKE